MAQFDMQGMQEAAKNFASGYEYARDPMAYTQRRRLEADMAFQQQARDRQMEQWRREDAQRAAIQQLGYDAQNGQMVEGSDNSFDVAEGKRLGMQVASTVQRKPMSELDVENRYGQIALGAGDFGQYQASRVRSKALEKEYQDKEFGAELQKIAAGDIATLGKYAREYNKDTATPGMLTLFGGKPHFVDPETGSPVPVSFAQIAQMIGAGHAAAQGDWKSGVSMMLAQQQYRDQRGDAAKKNALDERQVGAVEMNARTNAAEAENRNRYQMGMLGVARDKLGIDRMEAGAKAAAYNNMGKFGPMVNGVDAQGNAVPMATIMNRDGSISYQRVPLPEGVNFQRQVDPKIVDGIAARLDGMPTGRTINGKPEVYTPETAYEAALRRVQSFSSGAPANPARSDADAVVKFLREQGAQPPAKPAAAMPGREPASSEQRLRQMYLGGSR